MIGWEMMAFIVTWTLLIGLGVLLVCLDLHSREERNREHLDALGNKIAGKVPE